MNQNNNKNNNIISKNFYCSITIIWRSRMFGEETEWRETMQVTGEIPTNETQPRTTTAPPPPSTTKLKTIKAEINVRGC